MSSYIYAIFEKTVNFFMIIMFHLDDLDCLR